MQSPTGDGGEAPAGEECGGEDADSRPVAGDGGEEDEQPLFREEGDESDFRNLQPSRDFQATNVSGTILAIDGTIQTEKEDYLGDETTRFEAQSNLGFFEKKNAPWKMIRRHSRNRVSDGVFPANKGGNDLMEMRGSLLNKKDGNLAKDKSSFRTPPFLGFSSSTLNCGRGIAVSPQDFNMAEFLNLANRVVDTGDATEMEALAKLKT
ncbi:UNVERIFIED_CONTAM: hypothetical protein Sindi_3055900 [Sesamum indicum]